ncbi:hypothetical protein ACFX19_014515 [Malus domestica]
MDTEEGHGCRVAYSETTTYSSEGCLTDGGCYGGTGNTDSYSKEGHGRRCGYKKSDDDDSEERHGGRGEEGYSKKIDY